MEALQMIIFYEVLSMSTETQIQESKIMVY